ncbi:hypothetical protein RUND412_008231 [Rhizina undulata]
MASSMLWGPRSNPPSERTPLLPTRSHVLAGGRNARSEKAPRRRKWSTILALCALVAAVCWVLVICFLAPAAAETYAKEAMIFDVSSLSVESFTDNGAEVRVQVTVGVDATRVQNGVVRVLGRSATWIARKVNTADSTLHIYLSDCDNALLGTAKIPGMVIDTRDGKSTRMDFVAEVRPGSLDGIRRLANDYMNGMLEELSLVGETVVGLKSGVVSLGNFKISQGFVFKDLPSLPNLDITGMRLSEIVYPDAPSAMGVSVSIKIENLYPLEFEVPSLRFLVLLPGCKADGLVNVATATTSRLEIKSKPEISVEVFGIIESIPDQLVTACPGSHQSPMDHFLEGYIHGSNTTIYVTGSGTQDLRSKAPEWLVELLHSMTVPTLVPSQSFDNVIKSFSLSQVKFRLPAPDAKPGNPDSFPRLSAAVEAIVGLPKEMNFPLNVKRLLPAADVFYEGKKFGILNVDDWIPATSAIIPGSDNLLSIIANLENAPLEITDYIIFRRIVRRMFFGNSKRLILGIAGETDVDIATSLGDFVVKKIPASGNITIDSFPGFGSLPMPRVKNAEVMDTTSQSITFKINAIAQNPTPWEASFPYVNIFITHKGEILGNASIYNTTIVPGENAIDVIGIWDPQAIGGYKAEKIGAELIGEYISGYNTTLSLRAHENSFPSLPDLSKALAEFEVTIPTPRLPMPGNGNNPDDNSPPKFIESATMHVFSSTAEISIRNPLQQDEITIKKINGTAKYKGIDLGSIFSTEPFKIKPGSKGASLTPRLPVEWSLDDVALEAIMSALNGQLTIRAEAHCLVSVGRMDFDLFYNASDPIGAHIRA